MPSRLPSNLLSIIVAVLIAFSGYALFTIRFGEPLRQAARAMDEIRSIEGQVDQKIDRAIEGKLAKIKDAEGALSEAKHSAEKVKAELQGKILVLETQIADLRRQVARAPATQTLPGEAPIIPSVLATNEPAIIASPSPASAASSPSPGDSVTSDRKDGLLFTLHATRISSRGIEVDFSVTKEAGGDGYVKIGCPGDLTSSKGRIVTADGLELDKGTAGRAEGQQRSQAVAADLVEGVPTQFRVIFSGKYDKPMMCKRIEIEAFARKSDRQAAIVRFENVVVVPE